MRKMKVREIRKRGDENNSKESNVKKQQNLHKKYQPKSDSREN